MAESSTSVSFSSMSDDFLEARFSPEYRKEFQARLLEWDERKSNVKKLIYFFGTFDDKTEKTIRVLIQQLFIFATEYKLDTGFKIPEIRFYTPDQWVTKSGKPVPHDQPLPAANLEQEAALEVLNIILPAGKMSSEQVINTVRLLVSKIFGEIFFRTHVHHRVPYSRVLELVKAPEFSIAEKAGLCGFLESETSELQQAWIQSAKQPGLTKLLAIKLGKKDFFQLMRDTPDPQTPAVKALESWFEGYLKEFQVQPDAHLNQILEKILSKVQPSNFILPHERKDYSQLSEKPWTELHALKERLSKVIGYSDQLLEHKEWLDAFKDESSPFDLETGQLVRGVLQNTMVQLQKAGLVKIFLIEYGHLGEKQEKEKKQFPLWLYQHVFKHEAEQIDDAEGRIKKLTAQYSNSIYQKIFEASQRAINLIHMLENQPGANPSATPNFKRLKALLETIRLMKEGLQDMYYSALVTSDLYEVFQKDHDKSIEHIEPFEKAWSYFISFALVHQYYKVIRSKNKTLLLDQKFFQTISVFVKKKAVSQKEYRLILIFIHLYVQQGEKLESMLPVVKEECPVFDFIVFHMDQLFKDETIDEDAKSHADHLHSWLKERAYQNEGISFN